jgi:small subunit ribosomal protein S21
MSGLRRALQGAWGQVQQAHFRVQGSGVASTSGRCLEQARGVVSVDVHHNQVDRALRMLKRKVLEENLIKEWQRTTTYTKPSQERKLATAETEKRLRKRAFKEKLRWIMRRGERGF